VGTVALAVGSSTASARGIETGFLDPGALSTNRPSVQMPTPKAMYRVSAKAGSQIVRLYLYWNRVVDDQNTEPVAPQNPTFYHHWNDDGLVDAVDEAVSRGLKVMLTIRSAPLYAQGNGTNGDSRGTYRPNSSMLADFTKAATLQFPSVHIWGVWNEPNLASFLSPQYNSKGKLISPALYKDLLDAAAPVIHAADPQNIVVAGETAPFHFVRNGEPINPGPLLFLRSLLCMTGRSHPTSACNPRPKVKADIIATHPYTSGNVWHHAYRADDVSFGDLPQWKKLVLAAAHAGHFKNKDDASAVDLWITEFSWDTKPPDPKAVPTSLHVRWTAEALYRAWQLGIRTLIWGQLRDYPISKRQYFGQYQSGFYYANDKTKPSLTAFRFPFVAYAGGGRISAWGRTPGSAPGRVQIDRKTSSGWHRVTRVDTNPQGVFKKSWKSSRTSGYLRATMISGPSGTSHQFSLVRPPDKTLVYGPFGCGGVDPPRPGCPS
jgi:Cellulase (glycosyl hydrolase family 5)